MIDIVLLVLKIGILVLLYLFIWQVVKTAVRSVRGGGGAAAPAAAAPDVALPAGDRLAPTFTPAERDQRREDRLVERTIAGEKMDFSAHINPRLVVEESPIIPPGVVFPLEGWINVGRAASQRHRARRAVRLQHARSARPARPVLLRRGPRQHQRHVRRTRSR